jgi:hypothetical protein
LRLELSYSVCAEPLFALLAFVWLGSRVCAQEEHFWGEELGPIFDVLTPEHLSGFLEFSEDYDAMRLPSLPQFRTVPISKKSPLQDLRKIVASVHGLEVSQSANGRFLIRQRGVPADVLNIRISHLTFEDNCFHDIYSANRALNIILQAPEVSAYAGRRDIGMQPFAGGIGIGSSCGLPPRGTPHFFGSVDNVTVGQALEKVLQEFPGEILVYWDLPKIRDQAASGSSRVNGVNRYCRIRYASSRRAGLW